jgi:flagellar biosynthetic protein FliQ
MSAALGHVLKEGLFLVLLLSAPPVLAVLVVGAASALLQTVTQVREASLSAVPKVIAALVALAVAGPWIGAQLIAFTRAIFEAVPGAGRT